MLKHRTSRWVWQFFWLQSAALSVYITLFFSKSGLLSAALGSFCYLMVQFVFIKQTFSQSGAQHSRSILSTFYWAEAVKLLFFAILCYLCLQCFPINPMIFLGATMVAQSVCFWGPFVLNQSSEYRYE